MQSLIGTWCRNSMPVYEIMQYMPLDDTYLYKIMQYMTFAAWCRNSMPVY